MYCLRCGAKLDETANFCKNCGTSITKDKYQDQYNYNMNYSKINEEDYQKAYIGNNYEKIKEGKFSLPTFFFGIYYTLYRKMWLYSFIWIGIIILTYVLLLKYDINSLLLIPIVFGFIMSFSFNKLYMQVVDKRVEKIKQKNSSKTNEEILTECKKKGGGSALALILSISFMFIVSCALLFSFIFQEIENGIKKVIPKNSTSSSELIYEVPKIFDDNSSKTFSSYKSYRYFGDKSSCSISISNYNIYGEKTVEDYLKSDVTASMDDTVSEILPTNINGTDWKYVEVTSDNNKYYYYATIHNNKIYKVRYNIYRDDDKLCSNGYNEFINSLSFKPIEYGTDSI